MRILIAADHAGYELKRQLVPFIRDELGHQVEDLGTHSTESCHYPDYAVRVARGVVAGEADLGILICGTGIGMSVAANKVPGAVAARCGDCYSARMARAHNDANVLCLGGRVIGVGVARDVVQQFLTTAPMDDERLVIRRQMVAELDRQRGCRDDET